MQLIQLHQHIQNIHGWLRMYTAIFFFFDGLYLSFDDSQKNALF